MGVFMSSRLKSNSIIIAKDLVHGFDHETLFGPLSFCISNEKIGLIGHNGAGKSTLAKLLAGFIEPSSGRIERLGQIVLCPQLLKEETIQTVAQYLGVGPILEAQNRLLSGDYQESDFILASRNWTLEEQIKENLDFWGLSEDFLSKNMSQLSGGEQTKIKLIQMTLMEADLYLFDEPTNNLDSQSRALFIKWLSQCSKAVIVISHDRALLEKVDRILYLGQKKITEYGGGFSFYQAMQDEHRQALEQHIHAQTQKIHKLKRQYQQNKEKQQQREKIGKNRKQGEIQARGYASKMYYNDCRNQAEKTQKRQQRQADRSQQKSLEEIKSLTNNLEQIPEIAITVNPVHVHAKKLIIDIQDLSFAYENKTIFSHITWQGIGPFRVAIKGNNGVGKSTLLKLICKQLKPNTGHITTNARIAYVAQNSLGLDETKTVFETFLEINPNCDHQRAHNQLSLFLFKDMKQQLVANLSGGERMRLCLASKLLERSPPELLILDEPTNHMDLASIECIEAALKQYNGALLVVSHDETFIRNLGIVNYLEISELGQLHKV